MNEEQINAFEAQLEKLRREVHSTSLKLQELQHSARRAGSVHGYLKSLNKTQYLFKILEDLTKDYRKSAEEHRKLLQQDKDSEKNQTYNYSKIDLNKLPIRKK
jgi:hypothetical protein